MRSSTTSSCTVGLTVSEAAAQHGVRVEHTGSQAAWNFPQGTPIMPIPKILSFLSFIIQYFHDQLGVAESVS